MELLQPKEKIDRWMDGWMYVMLPRLLHKRRGRETNYIYIIYIKGGGKKETYYTRG